MFAVWNILKSLEKFIISTSGHNRTFSDHINTAAMLEAVWRCWCGWPWTGDMTNWNQGRFLMWKPHPRTFSSHHIAVFYLAQDFYKQALILSKQLLCCFFNEKQYKSGYHITFNTLCTVKRDNKRSRMLECKQTIIITTSILLTVQLCVSSPLITALLWWFNINLFIHLLLNIKQSNIKETAIWNINDVIFFSKLEISCPFLGRYLTLKWQPGVTEWKEIARF